MIKCLEKLHTCELILSCVWRQSCLVAGVWAPCLAPDWPQTQDYWCQTYPRQVQIYHRGGSQDVVYAENKYLSVYIRFIKKGCARSYVFEGAKLGHKN